VLTFFAMLFFPESQQVWPVCQKAPDTIDVLHGERLEDDAAELILKNPNLRASFDLVLAAELRRDHKLAL
jgi:hypothetical protein